MLDPRQEFLMHRYHLDEDTAGELLAELDDTQSLAKLAAPLPACPRRAAQPQ